MQKVKVEPAGVLQACEQVNCDDTAKTLEVLGITLTDVQGREFLYARIFVEDNSVRVGVVPTAAKGEIFYPTETCILVGRTEIDQYQFINETALAVASLNVQVAYE
jgi:hypothetical protein